MKPFIFKAAAVVLLAALLFGALALSTRSTMGAVDWQKDRYTVTAGDTLWEISSRYCPETVDNREWIEEVKTLNGMTDSTIYPGQVLVVLTPSK
jgi:nucleoid-associated protein YgaU